MSVRWTNRDRRTSTGPGVASDRSGVGVLWVGLILSALVLTLLLIFILQNSAPVRITFLAWDGVLPAGISLLFAAVAGALIVAVPGSLRILQLRSQARSQTRGDREPESRP